MDLLVTVALLFFFSVILLGFSKTKSSCPGPGILENITGLLTMKGHIHVTLTHWAKKYGNVYGVFLGTQRFFIINDIKSLKEVYGRMEASGRPKLAPLDPWQIDSKGVINSDGPEGSAHRTFTRNTLKFFGFGRPDMSHLTSQEISHFIEALEEIGGQGIPIQKLFLPYILNLFWITILGKRFSPQGTTMAAFLSYLSSMNRITENPLAALHPSLVYYLPWLPVWKDYTAEYERVSKIFDEIIKDHQQTRSDEEGEPRDFIDAYLDEVRAVQTADKETSVFYGGKNLIPILIDFLIAGPDATNTALEWCTLCMLSYPNVQAKVREELKQNVGKDRLPTLDDRPNLPYTEATIMEIMRLNLPTTIGVPHRALEDIHINGVLIPKNASILANFYLVHYNKEAWGEDAESFRPERWLSQGPDGTLQVNKNNENFIAFSTGRRRCPGEYLAKDSIFLFLSRMLTKFNIGPVPGQPTPSPLPSGGILYQPQPFSVVFTSLH